MILTADQIRARVDADWPQILGVVEDRIALRPISAHGINGEHMRKSAEYVANKLREVGVDAIIAEGTESGGHVGEMATMALVPQVVDAVDIPVLGAGGIGLAWLTVALI